MSDVSLPNKAAVGVPDRVRRLISSLRLSLRWYAAMSGLLVIVAMVAITFWITSGLDQGWFALQRLELPVGIRVILLAGMIGGGIWLIAQYLLKPLLRPTRDTELALLLERRFPEFQDRLMTTVEGENAANDGAVARGMLRRTVEGADAVAAQVTAQDVFDFAPLKKQGWMAALLSLSVLGSALASPGSLNRWWNAFVLCKDVYHERTTTLEFTVIAQPGERRLNLKEQNDALLYLHPRGADFELEMTVPEGNSDSGNPWIVPERVRVDITRFDGSRSRTYLTPTAKRTFRFILTRLQETVSVEVLAGDYRTRKPIKVKSVAPPEIDSMEAECDFPAYTGLNQQRETTVPILGSEVSLPIGTRFQLTAVSNKPLQSANIMTDAFEISGDRESVKVIAREGVSLSRTPDGPLISEDGRTLKADFQIVLPAVDTDSESTAAVESAELSITSNTSLKFVLHDEDDIISTSPESLRVQGIPDRPPVIATRMQGVGNAITRKAIIPMTGVIRDDYGLASAEYQFLVDDETNWRSRQFLNPFTPKSEFDLEAAGGPGSEFFRVQELVSEGQTLALTVVAKDSCTIPGPNEARAEPILFRIVSDEELLSLLYSRELTLRSRFEEVIQQLTQIRDDLTFHLTIAKRVETSKPGEDLAEDRQGLSTSARLNGDNLRRQNNELQSIAENFAEIRQQLLNNSIPPRQLAEDMNSNIITPMQNVITGPMVAADRSLSRFRVAARSGNGTSKLVADSVRDVSQVIVDLKLILENVHDMAEFHEIYQEGKFIHEQLLKLWAETRELQRQRTIEKLKLFE